MLILELILLGIAVAAIGMMGVDLLRAPGLRRRERDTVRRLTADESEDETRAEEEDEAWPSGGLAARLRAAGLGLGLAPFLAACVLVGVLAFLAVVALSPRAWLAALLVGALAAYLPLAVLAEWLRWRAWRFEERLLEAIETLIAALHAGENVPQGLATAAEASREPVRSELAEVVRRLDAGMGMRAALRRLVERHDAEGTRLFAQTLAVQWVTGGDVAPVLESVARMLRERVRIGLRVRSELAGVQISALVIAVLPYLMIPFFLWMRPTWAPALLDHPIGPTLLVSAVALQILGFLWLRRILRIEL